MPLVTLTCHKDWYPPEVAYASSEMSDQQMHIVDFARELPAFMLAYAEKLHLEPNTPPNAIQVD
ncbi:MAG TPA: hypothetical protein VNA68_02410, partial [Candidatus Dormibacteraeota bacterium]|nr:hypothetical protein [Candidatus Dormibacteraeota bacterium]